MAFPQFSEPGTWRVFVVELLDVAGNQDLRTTTEQAASGFPTELQVVTLPDMTPPSLAGFNFLPRAIDTRTSAGRIKVSFHVTDDRSGVAWAKVSFVGPGPAGTVHGCTSLAVMPGQEPALDLVLACDVDFPQFSPEGTWRVYGVDMQDVAGNSREYATSSLLVLGFPTDLLITSTPDNAAPRLIDFDSLDALAWYAAGAPKKAGNLTRKQLDGQIKPGVDSYQLLLKAKAERGEENDYARTRTWKLIQKYSSEGTCGESAVGHASSGAPIPNAAACPTPPWNPPGTSRDRRPPILTAA